ncbi:MAG TPA: DUF983 domain-containing protein [Acidimicrobiales bacterium]|nr:DUF983 domain-containing protein [Acidimicrobiales bacterium]
MGRRVIIVGRAKPGRMVARGAVCRCPRCGRGKVFESWFKLRERCPGCGMRFEREEGFWLGGYVINFATGEAGIMVLLAVLIGMVANGHHINAVLFITVGLVVAVVGPLLTFPFSRTLWSAIDLIMRPLSREERVDAQAAVATAALHDEPVTEAPPRPPPRPERAGP